MKYTTGGHVAVDDERERERENFVYKHFSFSSLVFSLFLFWFDFVGRNLANTRMNCLKFTVSLLLEKENYM